MRYFTIYGSTAKLNENFDLCYGIDHGMNLQPCEIISDDRIKVCIVDNNTINPNRLLILEKDRAPIVVTHPKNHDVIRLDYPGKSAFLEFGEVESSKKYRDSAMNTLMMEGSDRRDHLFISTVGEIKNAGWYVFWAPLQSLGKVMHARMVHFNTLHYGEDPNIDNAMKLANAFTKVI